jgi:hypothetical protein
MLWAIAIHLFTKGPDSFRAFAFAGPFMVTFYPLVSAEELFRAVADLIGRRPDWR